MLHLHNFNRWLVLLFGLLAIFSMLGGFNRGAVLSRGKKKMALFFLIVCDLQLLLGIYLYVVRGWFDTMKSAGGEIMKNSVLRFWTIEHGVGMIVAIILVHIGYSGLKKVKPDNVRMKKMFWCSTIALVIILATIPWPGRGPGIERSMFPGSPTPAVVTP